MNKVSAISNALRALQNTDKDQALTTKQNQMIKKSLSVLSKNSQIGIIQAAIKDGKIHQFDVDDPTISTKSLFPSSHLFALKTRNCLR